MISGEIRPDNLARTQDSARAIQAVRDWCSGQCDDHIPFLLLPVRIETRFLQSQMPIEAGEGVTAAKILPAVRNIDAILAAISQTDLKTKLQGSVRQKGAFKRRVEGLIYARLEERLNAIAISYRKFSELVRDCSRAREPAQIEELARLGEGLDGRCEAALARVRELRSAYWRDKFTGRVRQIRSECIEPLRETLRSRVLPALKLERDAREAAGERVLSRREIPRAAAAVTRSAGLLRELEEELAKPVPGVSRVPRAAATVQRLVKAAGEISAVLAEVAGLPEAWSGDLAAASARVLQRMSGTLGLLDSLAAHGGAVETSAREMAERAHNALRAIDSAIARTRGPAGERAAAAADLEATGTQDELRVRIYPDDIAVHTHEEDLTASEVESGKQFWTETVAAGGLEPLELAAWRALCAKHGSRRAAWIARQMQPQVPEGGEAARTLIEALDTLDRRLAEVTSGERRGHWDRALRKAAEAVPDAGEAAVAASPSQVEKIRALRESIRAKLDPLTAGLVQPKTRVPDDEVSAASAVVRWRLAAVDDWLGRVGNGSRPALAFPEVALKDAAWTHAPHCRVLPDRFVVLTVQGGTVTHAVAGEAVPQEITVGLDPDPAHRDRENFHLDEDGNLVVGESIRWMTDYEEARRKGMAVTVPISQEEAQRGFDQVLVLGLKMMPAGDGQDLLERLLENHHYGQSGLAFLPVGTATNNTEQRRSGFSGSDDADASFRVERRGPLFTAQDEIAADGLRFARALGIDSRLVEHVENAGGRDISEAQLVGAVLWPATLGEYLEEFFGAILGPDTLRRLREFFTGSVSARGMLPAFRVGSQPYGVLTTTALSRFVPAGGGVLPPLPAGGAASEETLRARFEILLRDVLARADEDWTRIRQQHVKHVHSPGVTDAQQHFLQMLGQVGSPVAYEYRFALNCAQRQPGALSDPTLDFIYPRRSPGAEWTAGRQGPAALFERFEPVVRAWLGIAANVPMFQPTAGGLPGLISDAFRDAFDKLLDARAYSVRHLVRSRPVRGAAADNPAWLAELLAADPLSLSVDAQEHRGPSSSLLFLLLRHALLIEYRNAALDILQAEGLLSEADRQRAGSESTFRVRTLTRDYRRSKWSFLFGPLSDQVDAALAQNNDLFQYLAAGGSTMAGYLADRGDNPLFSNFNGRNRHQARVDALRQHAARAARLGEIPAARLAQLVAEHLSLCSDRLDAWRLGLANQRLQERRLDQGIFLGAYGWVEDLRPAASRTRVTDLHPKLAAGGPVYSASGSQGFLHAPSLSHAVAAAILRSGYLSESDTPDLENRMAVNLSSRRVRRALDILDGLRQGHSLGSLLGYWFERSLHEAAAGGGPEVDEVVYAFRRAFPGRVNMDPNSAASAGSERVVVDGLAVLDTVRASVAWTAAPGTLYELLRAGGLYTGYPWGLLGRNNEPVLPRLEPDAERRRLDAVLQALDGISDALDALGDLALSESVYQIVRGNPVRASAVLTALATGKAMPHPEVVDTPRSGAVLSHRLLLNLEPVDGRGLSSLEVADPQVLAANRRRALPEGWKDIPTTARAAAEPSVNRWLGSLLGSPDSIVAAVRGEDGGNVELTVQDLGLQPLDLLALLGGGLESAGAELGSRILEAKRANDLAAGATPSGGTIVFERGQGWDRSRRSFLEAAALIAPVRDMLAKARPLDARDFLLEEAAAAGQGQGWHSAELEARVRGARAMLLELGADLAGFLSDGADRDFAAAVPDPRQWVKDNELVYRRAGEDGRLVLRDAQAFLARRAEIVALLFRAADFGVQGVCPEPQPRSDDVTGRDLLERLEAAFVAAADRAARSQRELDAAAANTIARLTEAGRALFGEGFAVLPSFALRNAAQVRDGLASDLLRHAGPFALDRWLHGVAPVREQARRLSRIRVIADAFGAAAPSARLVQLPAAEGDLWLGAEVPPEHPEFTDKLSLVIFGSDGIPADGGVCAGWLIDQWVEILPSRAETTGIAFHYEQPDAAPPQSLLLAVAPRTGGRWNWDDLVHTLHDTLELAKNRLMELEHLEGEVYAQLLPAVAGEVMPRAVAGAVEEQGTRLILDFGANR